MSRSTADARTCSEAVFAATRIWPILFLFLVTGACSAGESQIDSPVGGGAPNAGADATSSAIGSQYVESHPFFKLLRFTHINEPPFSAPALVERSHLIVRGRMEAAEDGRTIDFIQGASHPLRTAVLKFRIETTVKGPVRPAAYVEFIRGGITIESINEVMPRAMTMMLFLRPADGWDPKVYRFEGADRGVPPGERLDTLTKQTGLVVEWKSGIDHPLAEDPRAQVFDEQLVKTLTDLQEAIVALSARPDAAASAASSEPR